MRIHLHLPSLPLPPHPFYLFYLVFNLYLSLKFLSLSFSPSLSLRTFIKCYWPIRMTESLTAQQFPKG